MSEYYKDKHRYDDIIELEHHVSSVRAHMSLHDRAAQFAPFAALNGHEEAIEETARLTDSKIILDEGQIEKINEKLYKIVNNSLERINVSITYFKTDGLKGGGAYLTDIGVIKKINDLEKYIVMESGMKIPMDEIIEIEET